MQHADNRCTMLHALPPAAGISIVQNTVSHHAHTHDGLSGAAILKIAILLVPRKAPFAKHTQLHPADLIYNAMKQTWLATLGHPSAEVHHSTIFAWLAVAAVPVIKLVPHLSLLSLDSRVVEISAPASSSD